MWNLPLPLAVQNTYIMGSTESKFLSWNTVIWAGTVGIVVVADSISPSNSVTSFVAEGCPELTAGWKQFFEAPQAGSKHDRRSQISFTYSRGESEQKHSPLFAQDPPLCPNTLQLSEHATSPPNLHLSPACTETDSNNRVIVDISMLEEVMYY